MKRFLMAASLLALCAFPAQAQEEKNLEENVVQSLLLICVPPLVKGEDPALAAEQLQLAELPPERVAPLGEEGSRVFRSPRFPEKILILMRQDGSCAVAARDFDTIEMMKQVETYFGVRSAFKRVSETDVENGVQLGYEAKFPNGKGGSLSISLMDKPVAGKLQGYLSFKAKP